MGELLVESVEHLKKLCMDAPNQKLQLVVYVSANSESAYQVMYRHCGLPWAITTKKERIPAAKKWAEENGFDRLRIANINLSGKPDFAKTINI